MTPAERAAVEAETIAKVVEWLRREAQLCDCFACDDNECACGARLSEYGERSYKTGYVEDYADAIERGEHRK